MKAPYLDIYSLCIAVVFTLKLAQSTGFYYNTLQNIAKL